MHSAKINIFRGMEFCLVQRANVFVALLFTTKTQSTQRKNKEYMLYKNN